MKLKIRNYLLILTLGLLCACGSPTKNNKSDNMVYIEGGAQGTTYHIKYLDETKRDYSIQLDSILKAIDTSMSTYIPISTISKLNTKQDSIQVDPMFLKVLKKSFEVSEKTNGAFDVTLAPVINAWGWGFTNREKIDSALIDSLMQFVGRKHFHINGNVVSKDIHSAMLDFNAIAQGFSVDVLCQFLEAKSITNYMVEVGGEVRARGHNDEDVSWRLGIDKPVENETTRKLSAIMKLDNKALATSGNYRKFYVEDGVKYTHEIDPKTGYPARHTLLSASVVASDCMTADAYATAFMVLGFQKSKEILNSDKSLDAFLIYSDSSGTVKTYTSPAIQESIEEVKD